MVSLRLRHPALSPTEISAALGMQPTTAHAVGEVRTTPAGAPLDGRYHETYWSASLTNSNTVASTDTSLEALLGRSTHEISARRAWLQQFAASGGSAEYFVGLFLSGNAGVTLSPALMTTLSELGVALAFDLYD
jgi:hypothetical protein